MSKSPYEVRLEVMQMAQMMLERETHQKTAKYDKEIDMQVRSGVHPGNLVPEITANYPSAYTAEEIVDRAKTLYDFVNTNKN